MFEIPVRLFLLYSRKLWLKKNKKRKQCWWAPSEIHRNDYSDKEQRLSVHEAKYFRKKDNVLIAFKKMPSRAIY